MDNQVDPQSVKIVDEVNGEEDEEVVNVVVGLEVLEVDVVDPVVLEKVEGVALGHLTPLLATGAGCMAIWPVTVLNPVVHSHREVAILALPVEDSLNPGIKAQEDVDVVGKSHLRASTSCMTMRVILTPSMMQGSCMCPWILDRLLLSLLSLLRRKLKNKQKT